MAENDIGNGNAQKHPLSNHRAAGESLERIDGAQVTFAQKNPIVPELLSAPRAFVNFFNGFYAAVNAVQAELH
jgi:hypothetical protein